MSIRLKDSSSVAGGGPLVFSALSKEELQTITDFLTMKKIKIKNEMEELAAVEAAVLDASSDEDEAMMSDGSDSDDGSRRKKKPTGAANAMDLDEDEDSEGSFRRLVLAEGDSRTDCAYLPAVDEDFQADSDSDGGSASSDDSDSDDGAVSGDDVAPEPKKKKQKTK